MSHPFDNHRYRVVPNVVMAQDNAIPAERKEQLKEMAAAYIDAAGDHSPTIRRPGKQIDSTEYAAIMKDLNERDTWNGKRLSSAEKLHVWDEIMHQRGDHTVVRGWHGGSYQPLDYGINPRFRDPVSPEQSHEHSSPPPLRDGFHGFARSGKHVGMANWVAEDASSFVEKYESKPVYLGGSKQDEEASKFALEGLRRYRDAKETTPGARFDAYADYYLQHALDPRPYYRGEPAKPAEIDFDRFLDKRERRADAGGVDVAAANATATADALSPTDRKLFDSARAGVETALNKANLGDLPESSKTLAALELAAGMKQRGLGGDFTDAVAGNGSVFLSYGQTGAPQSQVVGAPLSTKPEQEIATALPAATLALATTDAPMKAQTIETGRERALEPQSLRMA